MASLDLTARRLLLAGGFAVAVAVGPVLGAVTLPVSADPQAEDCTEGEENDVFTGSCVPHTVPNSPFSSIAGNPDLPAVNIPGGGGSIPCVGQNAGQCIGLAEEDAAEGPMAVPRSSFSASP